MGLIAKALGLLFGEGRNVVADTAEVFRVNAEAQDARATSVQVAAMEQMAAEFHTPQRGLFDRLMDALNRLPRPFMALGTLGLFLSAMIDPVWFAQRMQGISLVPEPLWWLLGVVVSFYFGARHQAKGQEFQRSIAATLARTPQVVANLEGLARLNAPDSTDPAEPGENPALDDWRKSTARG